MVFTLKISFRRVNQVWRIYTETILVFGEKFGSPTTSVVIEEERQKIKEVKNGYKLGARQLEPIIERDYGIHLPYNKIHRFLLKEGLAKEQ